MSVANLLLICRYFVAFSFDTTLGVSIAIIFHKAAVTWAKQTVSRQACDDMSWQKAIAECGSYGEVIPVQYARLLGYSQMQYKKKQT